MSNSTDVQTKQNLFEVEGQVNALQPFLGIHPPADASKTPPILAFTRKREVEIPWDEFLDGDVTRAGAASVAAIRAYFETSWGFENGVNDEWLKDPAHHLLETSPGSGWIRPLQKERPVYRAQLDKARPPETLAEGFVIRHSSGRLYLLINPTKTLLEGHFKSFDMYESAWQKEIDGVELVFETTVEAQSYYMDFEETDLRPAVIQRKYEELRILLNFAQAVKKSVQAVTNNMIEQITKTTLDADELEQLQCKVLRLEIGESDAKGRIQRLASDAARLGYLLFIEENPRIIKSVDKDVTLVPGKLYTTYKRTAHWTQYVSTRVPVRVGWWIFRHTEMREVKVPCPVEQIVEDYKEVDTSKDILAETRAALIKASQQVYVFEQTPSGLVSTDGVALQQIMTRCKHDEAFRRVCVVMLPVYEESMTGQRMVAKYSIFKRPLPGLVPTILPRLSLDESLSYRTAWMETQLGEMVNSINLAPDEERKVTITKRFEQETTISRTSTSIFDISRAETSDLATEMENQARQEQESSKSMQLSTKASGGYGPFSAEASASGGTSSSLKDVSQSISKVAKKAAQSVSSQNREEVSSTTTARTTISRTDETVATIRNINQGRSLNLLFFRLYNKYSGGLFLEGLRFDVIPSVEVIAGSGVYESKSYSLEELPNLINEFKAAQLPFAIKYQDKYTNRLLDSIETLLSKEYLVPSGDAGNMRAFATRRGKTPEPQVATASVARLSFPFAQELPARMQATRANADDKLTKLSEALRLATIHSDSPIAPQELLVAAPGLYLDAVVGAQPSTEPYSEMMRTQEVRMRAAEVAVKESESAYQRAMAMRLSQLRVTDGANCLTGVLPGPDRSSLTLSLRIPLPPGDWRLLVDKDEKAKVEATFACKNIIVFSWNEPQKWLSDDNLLMRIGLLNKQSSDTIVYPA